MKYETAAVELGSRLRAERKNAAEHLVPAAVRRMREVIFERLRRTGG